MYIGNDLQIAHPSYKIIDDISSGFNGSTTSFALQVSGATPVPFPISTQQVMISVNGVVQEPDPNGSAGFKLLGSNIVFSSAPANGHAFFGVINAGADYVTAGSEFPDGSATAPSFTFQDDQDTGWYRNASGDVGYSSNGAAILNFDGNGLTIAAGKGLTVDTSTLKVDAANNRVGIGTASPSQPLEVSGNLRVTAGLAILDNDQRMQWGTSNVAYIEGNDDEKLVFGVGAERMRIDSAGKVGIGVTPLKALHVKSTGAVLRLETTATTGSNYIEFNDADEGKAWIGLGSGSSDNLSLWNIKNADINFATNNTERMRLDSNGRLLLGHTASIGEARAFQIVGTTSDTSAAQLIRHSADSSSPGIDLTKSRNATKGSNTIVQDNDTLGQITFRGDDGTDLNSTGATIVAAVDGTPGANDMPGRLVFSTTADGSNAETERMRIDSSGKIGIGSGAPEELLHIRDASAPAIQLEAWAGGPYKSLIKMGGNDMEIRGSSGSIEFFTGNADGDSSTERLRIGAAGQLGIGGATYGGSGQVLTSGGPSAAPSWTTISAAPEITATASGAIAINKAVGVNSNGTISDIKVTTNVLGTPTATSSVRLYDDASIWYATVAYDPDEDIIFAGWWDSWKFRVMAGRMAADGSITWGSRADAATSRNVKYYSACYNANRKCFVLAYKNGTADNYDTNVQTATVNSENFTITFHSVVAISDGSTYEPKEQTIVYDSVSKKCIIGIQEDASPYKSQAWIVDVAGDYSMTTSMTNGQLANGYCARVDFCMGANSNFMSSWQAENNSDLIQVSLKTLNSSGAWTSNTAVQYEVEDPSGNVEWTSIAYDPNADKYIVAWTVPTDSNKLFACTLTVTGSAGSESISKGTTVEVVSGANRLDLAFDSTINKMACRYLNDSMYLRLKYLTISGTNITVGNEVSINGNNDAHGSNDDGWTQSIVHCDTAQRMFLLHSRGQDSNYIGYSTVSGGTASNNLSSFIGYANTAIADTASGAVAVTGNTNSGQSGLTAGTKYYLQKNGSLATTADTPSVEAGIALSATKLLINRV